METAFISSMLDRGIVIGLFVITFLWFIYKGIPAAIKLGKEILEKINAEHTHQITMILQSHEKTVETTSRRFLEQADRQHNDVMEMHEDHKRCHEEQMKKLDTILLKLDNPKRK